MRPGLPTQSSTQTVVADITDTLLAEADRCVKCGLCLPHCPTYHESAHEADSPRGRIALLQALAKEVIPASAVAERHLDGCLGCRACEAVCPAQVSYGRLIDDGRAWLAHMRPARARRARWIAGWLAIPSLRRLAAATLWLYQRSGLPGWLHRIRRFRSSPLGRLEALLPRLSWPRRVKAPAIEPAASPMVSLFTGCMGDWAERDAGDALARLLSDAGHRVAIPAAQECCGALYLHAGLPAPACKLMHKNLRAFGGDGGIVTLASGCAGGLRDVATHMQGRADGFIQRLQDPYALLATARELPLAALPARVALHLPCSQRLLPEGAAGLKAALRRIPDIDLVELVPERNCCGAAGSYLLTQPAMSDRLLEATIDAVRNSGAMIIVSSNIGCRLHLSAGLRRRGLDVEVLHPALLLQRQSLAARAS